MRKASADSPSTLDTRLNSTVTIANAATKPAAMNAGRARRAGGASEPPSTIGNTGNTQGAATVSRPAAKAKPACVMALPDRRWFVNSA